MQPGNKDNIVNISKFKHKQDPLNSYTMSLIDKGLPQDNIELSAQGVNWNMNTGKLVVKSEKDMIIELLNYQSKSLIRKIFDWLIVKGL